MTQQLDATIVDAWMEFMSLRERGTIEDLDEKHRTIIYVVAGAEARGEKINQKSVLSALGPRSAMPIVAAAGMMILLEKQDLRACLFAAEHLAS